MIAEPALLARSRFSAILQKKLFCSAQDRSPAVPTIPAINRLPDKHLRRLFLFSAGPTAPLNIFIGEKKVERQLPKGDMIDLLTFARKQNLTFEQSNLQIIAHADVVMCKPNITDVVMHKPERIQLELAFVAEHRALAHPALSACTSQTIKQGTNDKIEAMLLQEMMAQKPEGLECCFQALRSALKLPPRQIKVIHHDHKDRGLV